MHYITNADGYISAVSFGCDIECEGGSCTEYTGGVPTGYTSLGAWYAAESEKLYRWKIVNGELTLDEDAVAPAPDKPPYAPEGYGLGEESGQLVTDCNAAVLSGWYQLDEYCENAPDDAGHLMRVSACAGCVYQEVFTDGGTVTRWCKSGAWGEWEWINPPMVAGVEYRTTERCGGKPVYTKLVSVEALPNTTLGIVPHGIENMARIIDLHGTAWRGSSVVFLPMSAGALETAWNIGATETNIFIVTNADRTDWAGEVIMKYTKTTD